MTHPSFSDPLQKASLSNPHPLGNCLLLDPLFSEFLLPSGGGEGRGYGVGIFCGNYIMLKVVSFRSAFLLCKFYKPHMRLVTLTSTFVSNKISHFVIEEKEERDAIVTFANIGRNLLSAAVGCTRYLGFHNWFRLHY